MSLLALQRLTSGLQSGLSSRGPERDVVMVVLLPPRAPHALAAMAGKDVKKGDQMKAALARGSGLNQCEWDNKPFNKDTLALYSLFLQ